jgi:outer membrane cobalamin receptor
MTSVHTRSLVRIGTPLARAVAATLAFAAAAPAAWSQQSTAGGLEEVIVTATRREVNLQSTPVAVSASARRRRPRFSAWTANATVVLDRVHSSRIITEHSRIENTRSTR